jgi:cytochrome c oxidase cbb3-type subunit III
MRAQPHLPLGRAIFLCAVVLAAAACQRKNEGYEQPVAQASGVAKSMVTDSAGGVVPGINASVVYGKMTNPYAGQPVAERDGRRLFLAYNCVGCHGGRAGGGMGPSLRDSAWAYGGSDGALYATIVEGRPGGMPTWGGRIPPDQIWKLITYIRTLRTPAEPDPPPKATQPNIK